MRVLSIKMNLNFEFIIIFILEYSLQVGLYGFRGKFRCFTLEYKGFIHENRYYTWVNMVLEEDSGIQRGIISFLFMKISILHRLIWV